MFDTFLQAETWISLLTLTVLEIVLGIDNIIFISILSCKLPLEQQRSARQVGLILALLARLLLLGTITWLAKFTHPLVTIFNQNFSCRDLILLSGGIFLLAKGTKEIHTDVTEQQKQEILDNHNSANFFTIIFQIILLDIVFSLDSVITAVGMSQEIIVMSLAVTIAVVVMLFASEPLSRLIRTYPGLKMLALSFLLLVGVALVADGFHFHVPRGYLYFAISFSFFVEALNILAMKRRVSLHKNKQ